LLGDLGPTNPPNGFDLGVFGGFHEKVFLSVDFRFLLIEWVLGTELLTKDSP
jgi:hypothetical protein